MPAAATKEDLLARSLRDYEKLAALLDKVPEALRTCPDPDADGASLKDIVAHRGTWIAMFLQWEADSRAGKPLELPAPGYKWNDLKRFNANLRQQTADLSWDEARDLLARNHAALIERLAELDETALYGQPMPGGGNAWTTGRWAEAAGPSHYRSAMRYIRQRLRAAAD